MATGIQISGLVVLKMNSKGKVADLVQQGLDQDASSVTELSGITHNDTAMHGLATTLQTVNTNFHRNPPTATKNDVKLAISNLVEAYDENAAEIQIIARKEAKLAGDVTVGINIVKKAKYRLKDAAGPIEIAFNVENDGPGAVKISTKAIGKGTIYIREFGKTTAVDVVPPVANRQELLVSGETEIRLELLDRFTMYAFREASIVPISRKADSAVILNDVTKKATPSAITSAHRRIYMGNVETNYKFSPWFWLMVQ
ncbi:MAG: hypothetical protein WCH34_05840 [Bacteroidota bacterium]